ncbi:hypothetical protein [Sanguibacter suaedae]|uniref:Uncharacterized protein n=1 Tax=Sanguibacter suaedae TaxID=2795737 RepID=A0A934IAJ7_9MICO|nr:hypothetical protein [Sanguibacter suaedae]MBI9114225.1 hypothetical protein [Sanguibacter suaedae]
MVSMSKAVQVGVRWGPRIGIAVRGLDELNRRFPDAPGRAAATARTIGEQMRGARVRQSTAGRVRHVLVIVRDAVDAMEQDRAGHDAFRERAEQWRRRATDLDTALRLADTQPVRRRRGHLAAIRLHADALAEEVLLELGVATRAAATDEGHR